MSLDPFKKDDVVDILDGTPVNVLGVEDENGEHELYDETGIVLTVSPRNMVEVQLANDIVVVNQDSLKPFPYGH